MTATKTTKHGTIVVDDADGDLLAKCRADESRAGGYAYARNFRYENGKQITLYLHRTILKRMLNRELTSVENVDHINHDTLDCRRSNLRLATLSENHGNRNMAKNNTSGFKGVSLNKKTGRWRAQIRVKQKIRHLGFFADPADAHRAYVEAARAYFGEFYNDGTGAK